MPLTWTPQSYPPPTQMPTEILPRSTLGTPYSEDRKLQNYHIDSHYQMSQQNQTFCTKNRPIMNFFQFTNLCNA